MSTINISQLTAVVCRQIKEELLKSSSFTVEFAKTCWNNSRMPFENKIAGCPVVCGLIFHILEEPVPVPLKNVKIDAKIVDFVTDITVEQRYFV